VLFLTGRFLKNDCFAAFQFFTGKKIDDLITCLQLFFISAALLNLVKGPRKNGALFTNCYIHAYEKKLLYQPDLSINIVITTILALYSRGIIIFIGG